MKLAVGRSASVAAVVGAAGLGKTQLLAEASRLAVEAGFDVLSARGSELEQDIAFGLVRQLYEPTLVQAGEAERDVLLAGPAGNATTAVTYQTAPEDPRGDFAILHGLYWLTANLGERRPVALILDDLHWADTASLRFLVYLLPRLDGLPVTVFVALRPDAAKGGHLVSQLVTAPETRVIRLAPLSERAAGQLVQRVLETEHAESTFLSACFEATHGNPLLLRDLAGTFKAEGLDPDAGNVSMVDVLGSRAVAQRVGLWMLRLPHECLVLARAVAVLGDGCALAHAAELADLPIEDAVRAARDLERADLFRADHATGRGDMVQRVQFSHPLVRSTVYDEYDPAERVAAHRRAASLVQRWHGGPEQVAPHLLRVPPAQDESVVGILRQAAREAFAHGSPDTAATHLRRCLAEPPAEALRPQVQRDLAEMMTLVDTGTAAQDLRTAMDLTTDPAQRAEIAALLSTTLTYLLQFDAAERVCLDALAGLPDDRPRLRGPLEAALLLIPLLHPQRPDLADRRHALAGHSASGTSDSRELDCLLAGHAGWRSEPEAVELALRGLDGGVAEQIHPRTAALPVAWFVLITADRDEALTTMDSAIARAHQNGSVHGLTTAYTLRGLAWLCRGQLAEAEADIREGMRNADAARFDLGTVMAHAFLVDVLIEQGRLDEAAAALDAKQIPDPVPMTGPLYFHLDSRTRLLRQQGKPAEALDMALQTGRRFELHGANNPGFLSWRSEAARCAHDLGHVEQAMSLATENLRLATKWGAPRALGRALYVSGVIHGGQAGISLVKQAIDVLGPSPARLEHAAALLEMGVLLRKEGSRTTARQVLGSALDLATACDARPLRDRAEVELRATGARPKRGAPSGVAALTPSERRVAERAAAGHTNRQIAQELFVTVKTVEVHLTNAYRKVGVGHRADLAGVFDKAAAAR